MSCRRQREEGRGDGRRAVKDEEADGEWELDEEEEEEEEEESEIEDGGIRPPYRRHTWKIVASWSKIDLPEAYRRAEKIMTQDFNIGGGIPRMNGLSQARRI